MTHEELLERLAVVGLFGDVRVSYKIPERIFSLEGKDGQKSKKIKPDWDVGF